jgi:hypothetical protein
MAERGGFEGNRNGIASSWWLMSYKRFTLKKTALLSSDFAEAGNGRLCVAEVTSIT